jgi:hypothetical protein
MSFTQAAILKDSIDKYHNRLTTFRLRLPRIILAELNTHRINSKSTSSSRAIPVKSNIDQVQNNPFIPDQWTKNSRGMFSLEVIDEFTTIKDLWVEASKSMCNFSSELSNYELHKQYANRLLEPFMYVDTIFSGTDFDNFFHLRTAEDTQPEIRELANLMYDAYKQSIPILLKHGQWHLPYIDYKFIDQNTIEYSVNEQVLDLDTAIKVSISCCGQVSYRKLDTTVEKALSIYNKFVSGPRIHACYDKDTEFLTKTGWIKSSVYNGITEIAVVIPGSHEIFFEKPFAYNVYDDIKKMVHIDGQQLDLLTTFNHRHYVSKKTSKGWQPFAIEIAGDIHRALLSRKYLKSGNYNSQGVDYPIDFRLLGMYIGDGSESSKTVRFHLKKQRKIDYLYSIDPLITELSQNVFVLSNKCGHWLSDNCRNSYNDKKLPDDFIDMSIEQWILLKEGLLNSDGYLSRGRNMTYTTTSKILAEQLQILSHLHGESCSINYTYYSDYYTNHKDLCKLNFSSRITPEVSPLQNGRTNTYTIKSVDYNSSVFCPTVSTGLVLIRRNDKVVVSGNSALEHAATPFSDDEYNARMDAIRLVKFKLGDEISNFDLDKFLYKRNLRGWTQYRTMVANDTFINKFEK